MRSRIITAVAAATLALSGVVGAPATAATTVTISEVSLPATVSPNQTLVIDWRVTASAGLDTISTDTGDTAPGTWVFIGGPSGWVNWCPFPIYSTRTSGTSTDGRYRATCTLPAVLPNAEYSVWIRALDTTGVYGETAGTDVFTVVGGSSDVNAPTVSDVAATPAQASAGGSLTVTFRAQDASGVSYIVPWAFGPNGRIVDDAGVVWLGYDVVPTLVSGNERDGRYSVTLPVSATAVPGTYTLWFSVGDVIGNREASLYPAGPGSVYATYEVAASTTTVAGIPTSVAPLTTATVGTARVAFIQPAAGTSPILDYDVRWSSDPAFSTSTFVEAGTTTAATIDVPGLAVGSTYYFQVRAENRNGAGSWSKASSAMTMPALLPGAASGLTMSRLSLTSVRIGFAAPSHGGSRMLDYDLQYSTVANFSRSVIFVEAGTSTATRIDVTGLKRGTTYYMRVRATNGVGDGPWSAAITVRN